MCGGSIGGRIRLVLDLCVLNTEKFNKWKSD